MPHSEHRRTTYILGRVMFVVCLACGESAVSLVEHAGEGDLSHRAALRQETQSSYEATG